jgi:tRNA (cmo5U34)-methyltransferase
MKDEVFKEKITKQFEFDESVASVFDDMLNRSVPYYKEMLNLTTTFSKEFLNENDKVYDLGCSTATTLLHLAKHTDLKLELIGIDNSAAMLERALNKSHAFGINISFINSDIFEVEIKNAKVIISNYTLQFIRPLQREKLIKKIYDGLDDGGVFIFCEKVLSEDKKLNKLFIDEYYKYKKEQGYSEYEISQKREALENVLIPYTFDENRKMIEDVGFKHFDCLFKWLNFSMFVAIK